MGDRESSSLKRPNNEKPSADALLPRKKSKSRTISICVCASMLESLKGEGSKHRIIAQIARAAAIFRVSEIIIVDDGHKNPGYDISKDCRLFRVVLEYLDCPQYLRRGLFPINVELKPIGVAPPLDATHHLRFEDRSRYRDGVITKISGKNANVDVGLGNDIHAEISEDLEEVSEGIRVTVQLDTKKVVHRDVPRIQDGLYWGYRTRVAETLSGVISGCPYPNGYDLTVGTSERGDTIDENFDLGSFEHLLIAFGGPKGLEYPLSLDKSLADFDDPRVLYDRYLNTCPFQGSRTIRTEEAVLITLASMQTQIWI